MISPRPDAPAGLVAPFQHYSPSDFPPTCAILCRNTAPLVEFAFALLRRHVPCNILGRDIGAGLKTLVEKLAGPRPSVRDWLPDLPGYEQKEVDKLLRKGKKEAAANLSERLACIRLFCSGQFSTKDVLTKIDSLFTFAPTQRVTLSTIHKSKGLEWPLVYFLDRWRIPSPYAEQPWQLTQEQNLEYVAVTRAKETLRMIEGGKWK